jgi:5-methylcytosine-specific restriction endonuclease McrA
MNKYPHHAQDVLLDCGIVTTQSRCPRSFEMKLISKPNFIRKKTTAQRGYDSKWQRVSLLVLKRDKFICHYCQAPLVRGENATVDHVVPLFRGGSRLDMSESCLQVLGHAIQKKNN